MERQGWICTLTGRALTPENAELDHKLPYAKGGKHVISNVQIIHRDANRAKGTLSMDEFIALCQEIAAHTTQIDTAQQNAAHTPD